MEKACQHFNARLHESSPLWLLRSRTVWSCVLVCISLRAWSGSMLAAGSLVPTTPTNLAHSLMQPSWEPGQCPAISPGLNL